MGCDRELHHKKFGYLINIQDLPSDLLISQNEVTYVCTRSLRDSFLRSLTEGPGPAEFIHTWTAPNQKRPPWPDRGVNASTSPMEWTVCGCKTPSRRSWSRRKERSMSCSVWRDQTEGGARPHNLEDSIGSRESFGSQSSWNHH